MRPRFTGACLVTHDVLGLAAFYARVLDSRVEGDEMFAVVPTPGATLSLYSARGMERMAPGSVTRAGAEGGLLEFEVDDVDAAYARLRRQGAPVVKPPTTQPWGRRSMWLRDPDGTIVNLYQPVPPTPDPEKVVRRYFHRLLVDRDPSVCEDALASDYVDHDAPPGTPPGPNATRSYAEQMLHDHPDLSFTIDDLISRGRTVALRATWEGTQHETATPLRRRGLVMLRVNEAGRIVERWSAYLPP